MLDFICLTFFGKFLLLKAGPSGVEVPKFNGYTLVVEMVSLGTVAWVDDAHLNHMDQF